MNLLSPLGLLGLIGLLLLILIYILKPKYQEKAVSSTFIWKLSLKYKKQKTPFQWIKNSLLFILQMLILTVFAVMMAQPVLVLASKSGEKIVILEASAAMMAEQDGRTRFDRAVSEIGKLADMTVENDKFTVILATDQPSFLIRRSDSAGLVRQELANAVCTYQKADINKAMELVDSVLLENPNAEVILFTCREYENPGIVTIKNMAASESPSLWNAAILNFDVRRFEGYYVFTAKIVSYGRDADISVGLRINGAYKSAKVANCADGQPVEVVWDGSLKVNAYRSAQVVIECDDSFGYDNQFYIFGGGDRYRVQLVSETPGFLRSALRANSCTVVVPDELVPAVSEGFDMYVYDGSVPDVIPEDGAVWFINPDTVPAGSGLQFGGTVSGDFVLSSSGSTSDTYNSIMKLITPRFITVSHYTKITSYVGFERIMLCSADPVLLVKNNNGLKTVVMPFSVHNSNLPVLLDFPVLMYNMINYLMAPTVDSFVYDTGTVIDLNAKPTTEVMNVSGQFFTSDPDLAKVYETFPATLKAGLPGVYTVEQTNSSGDTSVESFFVRIPENESNFALKGGTIKSTDVTSKIGTDLNVKNDTLNIFAYVAAAVLVLLLIEWGVQYREQY